MALTSFEGTWEEIQLHGHELAGRYVKVMVLDESEVAVSASTDEDLQDVSASLSDRIMAIGKRCAALPVLDPRTADEILGYNDDGLPE